MMGYLASDTMTAQAIDNNGWLHTGDIGRIDKVCNIVSYIKESLNFSFSFKDGFLHVIGRKTGDYGNFTPGKILCCCHVLYNAELIALGTGLKIHPIPLEKEIKRELPFLSNVVVLGEGKKFLSCLVTLKVS